MELKKQAENYHLYNRDYETAEGDGGFLDSFNALKELIDYNYSAYKEQLSTLYKRQDNLKKDYRYSIKVLIIDIMIPIAWALLVQGCVWLGQRIGVFSVIYIGLILFFPVAVFVCDLVFAPGFTKNVVSYKKQILVLNSGSTMMEYRKKNGIISFEDEKQFLNNRIGQIEDFNHDVEIEGWDKKDRHPDWTNRGEMNDEQRAILDRMRSLSNFEEYRASVVETRGKVGIGWIFIILILALELLVFLLMLNKTASNIELI